MTEKQRCRAISGVGGTRGCRPCSPNTGREDAGPGRLGNSGKPPRSPARAAAGSDAPASAHPTLRKTGSPLRELPRFLLTLINVGQGPRFPHSRDEVPEHVGADEHTGVGWVVSSRMGVRLSGATLSVKTPKREEAKSLESGSQSIGVILWSCEGTSWDGEGVAATSTWQTPVLPACSPLCGPG